MDTYTIHIGRHLLKMPLKSCGRIQLQTKIPLNYETQSSYTIQYHHPDDGQGGIYDTTFVISVKDVNDAPTDITIV